MLELNALKLLIGWSLKENFQSSQAILNSDLMNLVRAQAYQAKNIPCHQLMKSAKFMEMSNQFTFRHLMHLIY